MKQDEEETIVELDWFFEWFIIYMHVAATRIDVDYLQFYQSLVKSSW